VGQKLESDCSRKEKATRINCRSTCWQCGIGLRLVEDMEPEGWSYGLESYGFSVLVCIARSNYWEGRQSELPRNMYDLAFASRE